MIFDHEQLESEDALNWLGVLLAKQDSASAEPKNDESLEFQFAYRRGILEPANANGRAENSLA